MENFNEFIETHKTFIQELSKNAYGKENSSYYGNYVYRDTNVYYGFDLKDTIREICFARLYKQMKEKENTSYYLLKLPYAKDDTKDELDTLFINYTKVFNEMKDMIYTVFDMDVYKTGYKNIKLITFKDKIELPYDLNYSLTLILFCLLRGMDSEYFSIWLPNDSWENRPIPETLQQYIYEYSFRTEGSDGHDINDNIANIFRTKIKNKQTDFKTILTTRYVDTLNKTFGINGVVTNENYMKYFKQIYYNKSKYNSYAMQTGCFDYIEATTNKVLLEVNS